MQACNHLLKISIADSAQPRSHSIVTRPFPFWEMALGARL